MIGNDIVDLSEASKSNRSLDPRYLDKTFSKAEQDFILSSVNPEAGLWLLWSMKESAYKINVRKYNHSFFDPLKIQCEVLADSKGSVRIKDDSYHTFSEQTKNFIHTIAQSRLSDRIVSYCFKLKEAAYAQQHTVCYKKLIGIYSEITGNHSGNLQILKNKAGVPELHINNRKNSALFSVSHHGHYGAIAMLNTPNKFEQKYLTRVHQL